MSNSVQTHYQSYPYPHYPLIASVRRCDTYALNLKALWARFNRTLPPPAAEKILIAGSGTFAPYPMAVANPDVPVTALDLSENSLRRAHLHCLLHGRRNVSFCCGDLLDRSAITERYGLIDSYGVLHHLENPLAGLRRLEECLAPGGILRVMLYSRYARRKEESIRRAFRLLGINTPHNARHLLHKAESGSRLANFMAASDEAASVSGLADALLHPCVHTYRIDGLLEMVHQSGLEPLLFAHRGALENPADEISRLRTLEKDRQSPGNFVLYLGRRSHATTEKTRESVVALNPCLISSVSGLTFGVLRVHSRLGSNNPVLTRQERTFLRRFVTPVHRSQLTDAEALTVAVYKRLLFLVEYS